MNIIEKRRRKAWAHATMVIMNKVIREASTGTIFIYGETLYGKDKEVMEGYGSAGHGTGTERVEDVGDS